MDRRRVEAAPACPAAPDRRADRGFAPLLNAVIQDARLTSPQQDSAAAGPVCAVGSGRWSVPACVPTLERGNDHNGLAGLTDRDDQGRLYFKRSGVVLIDEIDAHLHPEWQREIGFWLKRHFPNIQFLVTTHSPIICQAADPNGLFVLPEPGSEDQPHPLSHDEYKRVIASRPDTILLTSAFGLQNARSPKAVEARAQYAGLKAKERSGVALTRDDRRRMQQLELFALTDEEP